MPELRARTRRRGILFFRILGILLLIGAFWGTLVGLVFGGRPIDAGLLALAATIDTAIVVSVIAGGEIFLPETRLGRALETAPFLVTVGVKGFAYGAVIALVFGTRFGLQVAGAALLGPDAVATALQHTIPRAVAIAIAFFLSLNLLFVLQMSRLVGDRTLRDIVFGRYHRSRVEDRFFLFVDIVGSTPLAERVGPDAVHRFLGDVFRLASDPIDDHGGEVYQYVGDEIVITWTVVEGRRSARPLASFFAVERALTRAAPEFERRFGALPRLRGALHAGPVIVGEVGGSRRAIVYHGDVLNTASRMEQAARDLERTFLVSSDALERLEGVDGYMTADLGWQRLRGRTEAVHVHAVTVKAPPNGPS